MPTNWSPSREQALLIPLVWAAVRRNPAAFTEYGAQLASWAEAEFEFFEEWTNAQHAGVEVSGSGEQRTEDPQGSASTNGSQWTRQIESLSLVAGKLRHSFLGCSMATMGPDWAGMILLVTWLLTDEHADRFRAVLVPQLQLIPWTIGCVGETGYSFRGRNQLLDDHLPDLLKVAAGAAIVANLEAGTDKTQLFFGQADLVTQRGEGDTGSSADQTVLATGDSGASSSAQVRTEFSVRRQQQGPKTVEIRRLCGETTIQSAVIRGDALVPFVRIVRMHSRRLLDPRALVPWRDILRTILRARRWKGRVLKEGTLADYGLRVQRKLREEGLGELWHQTRDGGCRLRL